MRQKAAKQPERSSLTLRSSDKAVVESAKKEGLRQKKQKKRNK